MFNFSAATNLKKKNNFSYVIYPIPPPSPLSGQSTKKSLFFAASLTVYGIPLETLAANYFSITQGPWIRCPAHKGSKSPPPQKRIQKEI